MSKNLKTKNYEKLLSNYLYKNVIYCNEVALHKHNNFYDNKYVDFLALDRDDNYICYELKVSKQDFHSKHGKNFVGNYNYYVMPRELYNQVKDEIPDYVGCYVENMSKNGKATLSKVKKSVWKDLEKYDKRSLNICLMGALYREATRNIKSKLANVIYEYKYDELFKNGDVKYGLLQK